MSEEKVTEQEPESTPGQETISPLDATPVDGLPGMPFNAPPLPDTGGECRYCEDSSKHPERVSHLVCVETADGHIHVHAPFEDRRSIYRFLDAIENELVKHKREPEKTGDVLK